MDASFGGRGMFDAEKKYMSVDLFVIREVSAWYIWTCGVRQLDSLEWKPCFRYLGVKENDDIATGRLWHVLSRTKYIQSRGPWGPVMLGRFIIKAYLSLPICKGW